MFKCNIRTRMLYEPPHGKSNNLHLRKQGRRSALQSSNCEADQRLCFHYMDSAIPLLHISQISQTAQAGLCQTWSENQIVGFLMQILFIPGLVIPKEA